MSSAFPKALPYPILCDIRENTLQDSSASLVTHLAMASRRVLEVKKDDLNLQKWRLPLTEEAFEVFISRGSDAACKVFGEGSLFSPLLFGKFFDPADAFPLWEFESDVLLSGLQSSSKSSVDWKATEDEYVLRAEVSGARKCNVEACGEKGAVLEISGLWKGRESHTKDWRTGHWWEHGYVRRIELPENANCRKIAAYIDDDSYLEIKIPKKETEIKESELV